MEASRSVCAISILLGSILIFQCGGESILRCNGEYVFVSRNRSLLPLDDITALQGAAGQMGFSLERVVSPVSSEFWCASVTAGNYVNMTFTEPIVVEGIISSGAFSTGNVHFVSNFSILFSQDISGQLQLYNRQFTATSPDPVYYVSESITAQKFQFRINGYGPNQSFCWKIRILGCTTDDAEEISTPSPAACPTSTTMCSATSDEESSSLPVLTVQPSCLGGTPIIGQQSTVELSFLGAGAAMLAVGVILAIVAIGCLCGVVVWAKKNTGQLTEHTEYDYVMNTRWLAKDQNQICQEAIPLETNASYTTSGTVTNVNPPRGIAQTTNHSQEHILIEANPSYTTTSTVNEGQASGTPLKPNLEEDVLLEANPSYISSI